MDIVEILKYQTIEKYYRYKEDILTILTKSNTKLEQIDPFLIMDLINYGYIRGQQGERKKHKKSM